MKLEQKVLEVVQKFYISSSFLTNDEETKMELVSLMTEMYLDMRNPLSKEEKIKEEINAS